MKLIRNHDGSRQCGHSWIKVIAFRGDLETGVRGGLEDFAVHSVPSEVSRYNIALVNGLKMQEATRVLLNYMFNHRGQRVFVQCRNGHQTYGLIHGVSYNTWAVALTNATVRRGPHLPEIHNDFMVVNAFGILSVVFPAVMDLDPQRAVQRFDYAEVVYRQMMGNRGGPREEEMGEEEAEGEDPPERADADADALSDDSGAPDAPRDGDDAHASSTPMQDSGEPPRNRPRRL